MYTWIKLHGAIVFSLWILVFSSQLIAVPNYQFEENFPIALEPDSMQNQRYPYIAIDENGVVHIVFVKISELGKNIYYCQSEDLGATFSSPTQINTISNHVSAFGIAGPKIGLRGEEVIVTWADNRAGSPKLFMVFSSDGGQTWSEDWGIDTDPEMQLYVDLAVDFEGRLYLAYYAYLDETGFLGIKYRFTEPWSFDFSPSLNPDLTPGDAIPCSCCAPDIEAGPNGDVYIAFRNNINNIRDSYIARKPFGADDFGLAVPLSDSGWEIHYCPSSNPSISVGEEYIGTGFMVDFSTDTYARIGSPDELIFGTANNVNEENYLESFQNYPDVLMDGEYLHIVWMDDFVYSRDVYYGFAKSNEDGIFNVQRINDDPLISDGDHIDARLALYDGQLYSIWSDSRQGRYRIFLSIATDMQATLGDVNQDGLIDILDIVLTINFILQIIEPNSNQFLAADLNADESLDILDIVLLVNFILDGNP